MTRKKPVPIPNTLYEEIRSVLSDARASAYRAVNVAMVQACWNVGRLIVEHEQGGRQRAVYGEAVLKDLSTRLTGEFGRGFDVRNLWYMRKFYLAFPIVNAVRSLLAPTSKVNALRSQLPVVRKQGATPLESAWLRPELSWTHYRLLLAVDDARARDWYLHEAANQNWSTRQLERQISVLYYERLLASRKKASVRKEARDKLSALAPEAFIRDPYVLEFLDLKDYPSLRESAVEQAIIDNLQAFLLNWARGSASSPGKNAYGSKMMISMLIWFSTTTS